MLELGAELSWESVAEDWDFILRLHKASVVVVLVVDICGSLEPSYLVKHFSAVAYFSRSKRQTYTAL